MQKRTNALLLAFCFFSAMSDVAAQAGDGGQLKNAAFTIKPTRHGLGEIFKTADVHQTNYVRAGRVFGDVVVRYVAERKIDSLKGTAITKSTFIQDGKTISS